MTNHKRLTNRIRSIAALLAGFAPLAGAGLAAAQPVGVQGAAAAGMPVSPVVISGFQGFGRWLDTPDGASFLGKDPSWARLKTFDFNNRFVHNALAPLAARLPAKAAAGLAQPEALSSEQRGELLQALQDAKRDAGAEVAGKVTAAIGKAEDAAALGNELAPYGFYGEPVEAAVREAALKLREAKTESRVKGIAARLAGLGPVVRQALRLPKTLLEIHRIVKAEYTPKAFDENLWAHRGFHTEPWDPHYRQRTWQKVAVGNLKAAQVEGISAPEMASIMRMAMEIEDPILDYSHQSGEGFRFLLPSLGRFMGKNEEQARYAEEHKLPWCESAWCSEERRHGNALAKMVAAVTGVVPQRDNPNDVMKVAANEAEAVAHVLSRETTEWNASSVYVIVAAHAKGEMKEFISNVMRDEIKHLSIVSGADLYLFGPRPWARLRDMVKVALDFLNYHRSNRSDGGSIGSNPVTLLELGAAHLMSEYYTRKWLKTVPLSTLREVFEPKSNLPELAAFQPGPERQAEIDSLLAEGRAKRDALAGWSFARAKKAAVRAAAEARNQALLTKLTEEKFGGFTGAEPGSPKEALALAGIRGLKASDLGGISGEEAAALRTLLVERLRASQIHNNRHVAGRDAEALKAKAAVKAPEQE